MESFLEEMPYLLSLNPPAFQKFSIHWVLSLSLSVCLCLFVSLRLGHHQKINFQKKCGLYGLEYHIVELNGDVTIPWDNRRTGEDRAIHIMDTEC